MVSPGPGPGPGPRNPTRSRRNGRVTGPFTGICLTELGDRLRRGSTNAVELTRQALTAIEETQSELNAFVTVDSDAALAAARADKELAKGIDHGPLLGIPVAVKGVINTAGLTTAMGSRHFADWLPQRDAEAVARWRAAGAVVLGKTTTHELAYGPTGDRAANGPCANPRDPRRMAGGSSAGSAAAVAAGLVPLALGTDTGGSVRIPAALCGVVGLRPSFDRIVLCPDDVAVTAPRSSQGSIPHRAAADIDERQRPTLPAAAHRTPGRSRVRCAR